MRAVLSLGPAVHLRVVEVGRHVRRIVEEPRRNVLRDARRVCRRAVQGPRERVVEHGVGHVVELADVVHQAAVGIELPVPDHVRASDHDCGGEIKW